MLFSRPTENKISELAVNYGTTAMASLTPGVLSKLIQNAGNRDFKVTGEYRSPLLQVLEILPSLPGAGDDQDDPWKSRGFFLKVSDSVHSAYASISDEDLDLIYSDKIQLGQFVYVSRLDCSGTESPVPVLRGLKPVPKRRPCVGNPKDLVSSDVLPIAKAINFSKPPTKPKPKSNTNNKKTQKEEMPKKPISDRSETTKSRGAALETRRLSLDSARRVWDNKPASNTSSKNTNSSPCTPNSIPSPVVRHKRALFNNGSVTRRSSLSISPLKNKNEIFSSKLTSKLTKKEIKPASESNTPIHLIEVPLNLKTWSEQKISWNALPSTISNIGKQAVQNRNLAILAAAQAVEEASAIEGVIHCMCTFAELSESSQTVSAGPLVEHFLDLHQRMQQALTIVNSLLNKAPPETRSTCYENATSWVQAAVRTNLSKFKLLRTREKNKLQNSTRCHYIVIENTPDEIENYSSSQQSKPSPRNAKQQLSPSQRSVSVTKEVKVTREGWSKGNNGLKEAASLAEKLIIVSREWFLKYLERSLMNDLGVQREEHGSEIADFLRQLKRVNQWLDDLIGAGIEVDDGVEDLRKKLYRFLLGYLDLAVVSSQ